MALMTDLYGEDDPNATKPQQSPTSIVKQGLQPNQPTPTVTPFTQSVFDPNASTPPSTVSPTGATLGNPDPLAFSGTPMNAGTPAVGPMGGVPPQFGLPQDAFDPQAGGPQGGAGGPNPDTQPDLTAKGPTINGPTGGSYIDPTTGKETNSATPPTGVVYRPSEALLAGGTRTAQGDASNPLRGYVSSQGGTFGDSTANDPNSPTYDPNRALNMGATGNDPAGISNALKSGNQDAIQNAIRNLTGQQSASSGAGKLFDSSSAGYFNADTFAGLPDATKAQIAAGITGRSDYAANKAAYDQQIIDSGLKPGKMSANAQQAGTERNPLYAQALNAGFAVGGDGKVYDHGSLVGDINDPNFKMPKGSWKTADNGYQADGTLTPEAQQQSNQLAAQRQASGLMNPNATKPTNPNIAALIAQLTGQKAGGAGTPLTTGGGVLSGAAGGGNGAGIAQQQALTGIGAPTWSDRLAKGVGGTGGSYGLTGGAQTATQGSNNGASFNSTAAATPSMTATTPQNTLTNQTLSVGALNDPFQIAKQQFDAFQSSTNPEYQAELRDALRTAAAGGALGSGQLQSRLGDVSNYRSGQLDAQKQNLLANALGVQNDNAYKNVGVATQQQGFQNAQQQQAFGNEVQRQTLQEALTNGGFGRAMQQLNAGNAGNPADIQTLLASIYGNQADNATNAAGNLAKGQGQQAGVGNTGVDLATLYKALFGGN